MDTDFDHRVPAVTQISNRNDDSEEETVGDHELGEGEFSYTAYEVENDTEDDAAALDRSDGANEVENESDAESWAPSEPSEDDRGLESSDDSSNDASVNLAWEENIRTLHPSATGNAYPPVRPLPTGTPPVQVPAYPPSTSIQRKSTLPMGRC